MVNKEVKALNLAIGKKLRQLRGKRSLSDVAKAIGISQSAVAMHERGERIPRDEIKLRYANYYKRSVASIFFANDIHKK